MGTSPQAQEKLTAILRNKRICRFCMTQKEPLTNIYSKENRVNSTAPLPLQVMACVSIEVFSNDGMPSTICETCRLLMEYCYRFKQMCKKADNSLRQFPLTGKWPEALEVPKIPEACLNTNTTEPKKQIILNSIPVVKIEANDPDMASVVYMPEKVAEMPKTVQTISSKPKILNKNSMKILNKSAHVVSEPMLSNPIITRNESGQVEIVTEILDTTTRVEEPDPVLSAAPVETNVFPCPSCERTFPLRQLLDIHMVNHNRERSFVCEICEKRFFSKYDLGKHMLIHTGEKPYQCVVCKKAFTRSTLLHRHEKIHTDQPKFLCVYCEKPFLSKQELEKHTERHKKNRPFPCKVCGKSFAFKQGLERHETIHAKDQPFPCQYCDLSFSTPSKLSRHLTAHAGDRPFPCKLCPKSYLLSHHLSRHLRSHTQGSGSFKCYDCGRTFASRDDLIYHSAVHATQNLMCPLCKDQFSNLDQVTEHIKQHAEGEQYACEFCDLIFLTAEKLQTHSLLEHVEDMAAYEEHDKLAEKRSDSDSNMHDDNGEEEVIQEFIIEEYHDGEEGTIKEEKDEQSEEEHIESKHIPSPKSVVIHNRILNKQAVVTSRKPKSNSPPKASAIKFDEEQETEQMEVETLDQKEADEEYQPEMDESDSDENYEPPSKSIKMTKRISPRTKPAEKEKPAFSTTTNNEISVFKIPPKEPKLVQSAITSVLKQIPKSVTVMKKEKTSPPVATKKIASKNEVRILNEKIIRKADTPQPVPKSIKLEDFKTPVKVIEKKVASSSGNDNVPAKSKTSPVAGPSKVISPGAAQNTNLKQASASQQKGNLRTLNQLQPQKKLVEMMIDNRKVKVQKIVMTKAEVAAMAKEGKIEMKGGTMILKQNGKSLTGKVLSNQQARSN